MGFGTTQWVKPITVIVRSWWPLLRCWWAHNLVCITKSVLTWLDNFFSGFILGHTRWQRLVFCVAKSGMEFCFKMVFRDISNVPVRKKVNYRPVRGKLCVKWNLGSQIHLTWAKWSTCLEWPPEIDCRHLIKSGQIF